MAGTCGYGEGLSGSINAGNFLTSCKVYWLASQEGLCSMEQVSKCVVCCPGLLKWMDTNGTGQLLYSVWLSSDGEMM